MDRARVAVVGAGAWGTTLSAIVAAVEPVTLLCHSPEVAQEIATTRRNERRLPGNRSFLTASRRRPTLGSWPTRSTW